MPTNDPPIITAADEVEDVLQFVRAADGTMWSDQPPNTLMAGEPGSGMGDPVPEPIRRDIERLLQVGRHHGVDVVINLSTEEEWCPSTWSPRAGTPCARPSSATSSTRSATRPARPKSKATSS